MKKAYALAKRRRLAAKFELAKVFSATKSGGKSADTVEFLAEAYYEFDNKPISQTSLRYAQEIVDQTI